MKYSNDLAALDATRDSATGRIKTWNGEEYQKIVLLLLGPACASGSVEGSPDYSSQDTQN